MPCVCRSLHHVRKQLRLAQPHGKDCCIEWYASSNSQKRFLGSCAESLCIIAGGGQLSSWHFVDFAIKFQLFS